MLLGHMRSRKLCRARVYAGNESGSLAVGAKATARYLLHGRLSVVRARGSSLRSVTAGFRAPWLVAVGVRSPVCPYNGNLSFARRGEPIAEDHGDVDTRCMPGIFLPTCQTLMR
jgi:hypothetical protein